MTLFTDLVFITGTRSNIENIIRNLGYKVTIVSINKHDDGDSYTIWFIVPEGKTFNRLARNEQDNSRQRRLDSAE